MDSGMLFIFGGAFAPLLVLLAAIYYDRKQRTKSETPPQREKILRPPGYSLSLQFEELADQMFSGISKAIFLGLISGLCLAITLRSEKLHAPFWWLAVCLSISALFAVTCAIATIRIFSLFQIGRNLRFGLRGEQAVADALSEISVFGFRSFHDLCDPKIGNIDHIVVGTRGVFQIETKARQRRSGHPVQAKHEVLYDGEALQFPHFRDSRPIQQAKINAKWLSNYLEKKTGEPVWVEPLVVLPGWYISNSEKGNFQVKVMNATFLKGYLQRQSERIGQAQVKRIIAALDEKCRDIEF